MPILLDYCTVVYDEELVQPLATTIIELLKSPSSAPGVRGLLALPDHRDFGHSGSEQEDALFPDYNMLLDILASNGICSEKVSSLSTNDDLSLWKMTNPHIDLEGIGCNVDIFICMKV